MDESEIDLRAIFGLLRRRIWLIATTTFVAIGLTGLVLFAITPVYTASTLVLFDSSNKNLLDPTTQMTNASSDNARIESEVELLRSDSILLNVIRAENLVSDPEFGASLGNRDRILAWLRIAQPSLPTGEAALGQTLAKLRSALTVQRRGLTYLISIQVRSISPARAAELANMVANAYVQDQIAAKVNGMLASRDVLQDRIRQARDAVIASEGSFDTFVEENIERIAASGSGDIMRTREQIAQLEAARTRNIATVDAVRANLDNENWSAVVAALQSDALAELARQRDELAAMVVDPAVQPANAVDLRAELAAIDEQLRSAASQELGSLQEQVTAAQDQTESLRQNLRRDVLSSSLPPDMLTELYERQQSGEIARSQYQTLLSRSQDLEIQANLQVADSRVVSPALAPGAPSFPNTTLFLLVAALTGMGVGVALAFLYENLIGGFMSEEQVESVLHRRLASSIPRERTGTEYNSVADLMVAAPLSVFAESIRRLRVSIDLSQKRLSGETENGRVLMITSSVPNEGKSTLALALARSYAMSGQRTVLIDCDLRKPTVHRHLGLEPTIGLSDFLQAPDSSAHSVRQIISEDQMTGLSVVLGSRRSDGATDTLLASPSFARLIAAARAAFDVVVLDTPPIGPVVDGIYVASHADVIGYVVRWGSTAQRDVKQGVSALEQARADGGPPILMVLNNQDETRNSYKRKYGGYYESRS